MLSRRLLYFTSNAVWCRSPHGIQEEDIYEGDITELGSLQPYAVFQQDKNTIYDGSSTRKLYRYFQMLELYSARQFSRDDDALNAFSAILNLLKPSLGGEYVYGLPTTAFEDALLWLPASTLRLRGDKKTHDSIFPSWSWASWAGKIEGPREEVGFSRITNVHSPSDSSPLANSSDCVIGNYFTILQDKGILCFEAMTATLPMEPRRHCVHRVKSQSPRHLSTEICSYTLLDITGRGTMAESFTCIMKNMNDKSLRNLTTNWSLCHEQLMIG